MYILLYLSTNYFRNVYLSKKSLAGYCNKYMFVFICSTHNSCQISVKHEFSPQFLYKLLVPVVLNIRPMGA
jgi:hypothetical protein